MKQRFSKTLAWLLTAATVLTTLPNFTVWAADSVRDSEAVQTEVTTTMEAESIHVAPEVELPENDELFAMYAEQKLYDYEMVTFGTRARASLNSIEQKIYDALKDKIETVATSGGSTSFVLDSVFLSTITDLKTMWTNTELGVEYIENTTEAENAFKKQFDFRKIVTALLNDCPFDLYWYDKTDDGGAVFGCGMSKGYYTEGKYVSVQFTSLTFIFSVAKAYQSGNNTTVTTDVDKVNTAVANANAVVTAYKDKSEYEKLVAYKDYICKAVSYNAEAASVGYTGGYGDPWQLIYVFDNDTDTNVVCEGYAKAFQYLCDLGGLDCICVSGTMTGATGAGPHMWNVVKLGGKNYLVDVTNCDTGTVGEPDKLFMVGGTFTDGKYYTYNLEGGGVTFIPEDGDLDLAKENYSVPTPPVTYEIKSVSVEVAKPAAGNTPQAIVDGGTGYTASISWNCTDSFSYNTAYTATVTLTAKADYEFADSLTVEGWSVTVAGDGSTATLTRTYEATAKAKLTSIKSGSAPADTALSGCQVSKDAAINELPKNITYDSESGEVTVAIKWSCATYDPAPNAKSTFNWMVQEGALADYDINGVATSGSITVTNGSANAVNNSGTNKTITYSGTTYDVSKMFTKGANAGEATYAISGGTGDGTLDGSVLTITKAGTFTIYMTTAANGSYAEGSATATLTVNKASRSVSVSMDNWTYGDPAKTPVVTGDGTYTIQYTGDSYNAHTAPVNAGEYTVTVTVAETDLYIGATASDTFIIEKKTITASISGAVTKEYDGTTTVPSGQGAIALAGLVGSDDVSASATFRYASENVGDNITIHAENITLTGDDRGNYIPGNTTASADVGTITKAPAPAIKWPTASALTYGQKLSESTLTSTDTHGTFAWKDGNTIPDVGNTGYTVVYTPKDNTNYDYSGVELEKSISVTVNPVGQTAFSITGATSATYGDAPITLSAAGGSGDGTITWEISSGSGYASITGSGSSATLTINGAGTVTVKATKSAANYEDAVDTHVITIGKATAAASGFTCNAPADLVYSRTEKAATVTGDADYGTITVKYYSDSGLTTVAVPVNVGTYYVGVTTAGGANYEAVTAPINVGSFQITAKPVTVTADAKTMQYGGTVPELTYTHTLLTGDTFSGSLAVAASGTSDVGEYEITVGNLANSNYTINYTSAKLTITQADSPAAPTVTGTYTANGSTYTYTVTAIDGAEYSMDGGSTWQDSNVFAELTAGKYTFSARIKETKNVKAGKIGTGAEVDLSKFPGEGTVSIDDWTYGETAVVPAVNSTTGNPAVSYLYESTDGKGYSSANVPSNAGAYKLTVTFDATTTHNGTAASDTFTIRKAVPAVTAPTGLTADYGKTLADVVLPAGWSWKDADTTTVGNAGENTFAVVYTPADTDNYELVEKTVIITVSPITVTASVTVVGDSFTFNGSAQTPGVVVKNGEMIIPANEYTVHYTDNTNAGTAVVTILDAEGGNYTVSGTTTFTIEKKTSSALSGVERVFERNTATAGNEIDVKAMLPDDCGTVSYTITSGGYTVLENVTIDTDGLLTFDTTTAPAAASDTISVKVVMQNYTDVTLTVSVILNDKVPQEIIGVSAADGLVYNGKAQKGYTGTPTSDYTGAYEITYTGRDNSYNSSAAPVNAGDYTVTFKIPDSNLQYSGSVSINFTIGKAEATVVAYDQVAYVGNKMPVLTYRVIGLIGSDTIHVELSCSADMNYAGETPIVVTATDPNGNYEITTIDGTLTVKNNSYLPSFPHFPGMPHLPGMPVIPPSVSVTVPVSGSDAVVPAEVMVSGNTVSVDAMAPGYLEEVIGSDTITIDFSGLDTGKTITTVEIPVAVMKDIADAAGSMSSAHGLKMILSDSVSITFDADTLAEMVQQASGADIIISIESHEDVNLTSAQKRTLGDRPAYDISIISGGKHISDMGGEIVICVPYVLKAGEKNFGVSVCYVDTYGNRVYCKTSYDPIEAQVSWKTDHLSLYMIDYNENLVEHCKKDRSCPMYGFTDILMSEWYHDGIHYCMEHGLMQGVGNDHFDPNGTATRAMIVTTLWRLAGSPVVDYLMEFEDVPQDMWYTEAIRWAASMKIVEGYGNGKFGTDDAITREQIMAILNRYAASEGWTADIALPMIPRYTCSVWAENNVNWAEMNGLLDGLGVDISDMTAEASRAELAMYLGRFAKYIAK